MATFRHMLIYAPAVAVVLFVVAWVVSLAGTYIVSFAAPQSRWHYQAGGFRGSLFLNYQFLPPQQRPVQFFWFNDRVSHSPWGEFASNRSSRPGPSRYWQIHVPFLVLITAVGPLAFGAFHHFRFRLWHYLAYTAVVALQLAYYLRWQG
jgi:hypothetical protein